MKSREILEGIFSFLKKSEPIKKFCLENFNRIGTIQLGFDNDDLPPQKLMPVIVIGPMQRSGSGDDKFSINYVLFVSVTITSKKVDKFEEVNDNNNPATSISGTIELEGSLLIEDFRELVEEEIFRYRQKNMRINISGETLTESDFPIFRSSTVAQIEVKRTTRRPLGI